MGTLYGDISRIGKAELDSPEVVIGSDFFLKNFDIPEDMTPQEDTLKKQDPLENWQRDVNRALMSGNTAEDILRAMSDSLARSSKREEIEGYVRKYEGLMGTVFLDSGAIEGGFPMTLIPKRYRPFNRFAVNCGSYRTIARRGLQGGVGGSIEAFLNSADGVVEETVDICALTGLPVLKEGMFTEEVISELLRMLGRTGNTLRDLRDAMCEDVVRCVKSSPFQEAQTPDMDFNLKETGVTLEDQGDEAPMEFKMGNPPQLTANN